MEAAYYDNDQESMVDAIESILADLKSLCDAKDRRIAELAGPETIENGRAALKSLKSDKAPWDFHDKLRDVLSVAVRYAHGLATDNELDKAQGAAESMTSQIYRKHILVILTACRVVREERKARKLARQGAELLAIPAPKPEPANPDVSLSEFDLIMSNVAAAREALSSNDEPGVRDALDEIELALDRLQPTATEAPNADQT